MTIKTQRKINHFLNYSFFLKKGITSFVLLFFLSQSMLYGQDESQKTFFKIKLHDKTKFYAELLYETKDSLILQNTKGVRHALHHSEIKRSVKVRQGYIRKGKFYPNIVNYDKGYGAPTGIGLKKGEVYYENTMAGWNEINAGITDYLSLKIGFDNFSFLASILDDYYYQYDPVVFLSSKLAIPIIKDKWNIALAPAVMHVPNEEKYFDYAYLFLSNTFGNKNNNFTIGMGTDFFRREYDSRTSFITFSASLRLGPRISLISENWIILDHGYEKTYKERTVLNSFGIKIIGNHIITSITFVNYREPSDNYSEIAPTPLISIAIPISTSWGS